MKTTINDFLFDSYLNIIPMDERIHLSEIMNVLVTLSERVHGYMLVKMDIDVKGTDGIKFEDPFPEDTEWIKKRWYQLAAKHDELSKFVIQKVEEFLPLDKIKLDDANSHSLEYVIDSTGRLSLKYVNMFDVPTYIGTETEINVDHEMTTECIEDDEPKNDDAHPFCNLDMGLVHQYTMMVNESDVPKYESEGWIEDNEFFQFMYSAGEGCSVMMGKPDTFTDIPPSFILGRKIKSFSGCYGSYGMGGPGFFGIEFEDCDEVMVYTAWAANQYITLNDVILDCHEKFQDKYKAWDDSELERILIGSEITTVGFTGDVLTITLMKDGDSHTLTYYRNHDSLPPHGNGSKRKDAFSKGSISDHIVLQHKNATLWT